MTLTQLRESLKLALHFCTHPNNGSLPAAVHNDIQWAWENWQIDFTDYYPGVNKPDTYTASFRDLWIDAESFETELVRINSHS